MAASTCTASSARSCGIWRVSRRELARVVAPAQDGYARVGILATRHDTRASRTAALVLEPCGGVSACTCREPRPPRLSLRQPRRRLFQPRRRLFRGGLDRHVTDLTDLSGRLPWLWRQTPRRRDPSGVTRQPGPHTPHPCSCSA